MTERRIDNSFKSNCEEIDKITSAFFRSFGFYPSSFAFTPYRVCPLGAHTDHQLGVVTGFAVDKGIHMAYFPSKDNCIQVRSLQFNGLCKWAVSDVPAVKLNDWADYLRGATVALSKRYSIRIGIFALVDGELPIGGLSSSAAVTISFISAICKVNEITLSEKEFIEIAKEAENEYVGVSCGKLDQSCEVLCKKDHLLFLDTKDDSYSLLLQNEKMKPYKIAILFSGLERSLVSSKYNMRADECRCAAYCLKSYAGMEYGMFGETYLRDVPYDVYLKYKHLLPVNFAKRADHWYSECERVMNGVSAWKNGDIDSFGKIVFESGKSSIENWESGSLELIKLYEIMAETEGIYGGRFSGAGFKGCCIAIINPDFEEEILEKVEKKYCACFPELKEKYRAYICQTADGVIMSK